jgi:hypothetical protein
MWGQIIGAGVGAAGNYLGQKSGQAPGFGGGMDYFNKVARQPMIDTLGYAKDLYSKGTDINALMQQGIDAMSGLRTDLAPYLQYGQNMLGLGGQAASDIQGIAGLLANFNPAQFNAQYQAGQAYAPQFAQDVYGQAMSNAQGAINPMLQSIAQMNADAFNRQTMPGIAANAISVGAPTSKWGINNALAVGELGKANAGAAANLYGQYGQQALGLGGNFGLARGDAINRMGQLNTQLSNQLGFQQAGNNADNYLRAMMGAGGLQGNLLAQTNPYVQLMMQTLSALPGQEFALGQLQNNAGFDRLGAYQDLISAVGNAGTGGASANPGGGGFNYGQMLLGGLQGAQLGGKLFGNWGANSAPRGGGWGGGNELDPDTWGMLVD